MFVCLSCLCPFGFLMFGDFCLWGFLMLGMSALWGFLCFEVFFLPSWISARLGVWTLIFPALLDLCPLWFLDLGCSCPSGSLPSWVSRPLDSGKRKQKQKKRTRNDDTRPRPIERRSRGDRLTERRRRQRRRPTHPAHHVVPHTTHHVYRNRNDAFPQTPHHPTHHVVQPTPTPPLRGQKAHKSRTS